MQRVSEICEREIKILACFTPKVSAYSAILPKLLIKGLAKPLVICNDTPSNMEKRKKRVNKKRSQNKVMMRKLSN